MPAPLIASIITGLTIASVLFFVYKNIYEQPHYAHQANQYHAPDPARKTKSRRRSDTCPICLELYNGYNGIVTLPCDHTLHQACLEILQAANHTKCPLCRGPLSYTS